jgi:hypothetical protein
MSNYAVSSCRIFGLFTVLAGFAYSALSATDARVSESYGKLPLHFEANQGQTHKDVRFLSHGAGYSLYLTADEAVLVLAKPNPDAKRDARPQAKPVALHISLVGASHKPSVSGLDQLPGKANYFIGKDQSKWRSNVPTYAKVHYREVYPGIDLVYYGNQRQLEHDFVVAPGANPKKIVLGFKGAEKLVIDAQGDLVLYAAGAEIRQRKPLIYQEVDGVRKEVAGGYVLKSGKRVGFEVAAYDASLPLIIDPVLAYSTYLGGSGSDFGGGIAVDAGGNAYVTGITSSTDFPTTTGAFQTTIGGQQDAFIAKLDPTGSALVYSTYLGGSEGDGAGGIAVDADGNAYVTGSTRSDDFPTTSGAFQTRRRGSQDAFVTKLNPTGSVLVYSTYLGGSNVELSGRIAVDAAGSAYVTGGTSSADFPTTAGAFDTSFNGGSADAFVTKLDPSGSQLVYSTYFGGSGGERGTGIAVDAAGSAYVTGVTTMADPGGAITHLPTTAGAFRRGPGGLDDAFVAKFNPAGSALVYCTYLGDADLDGGSAIAVDADGNAYVTGTTASPSGTFPTTAGAFQTIQPARGARGGFVTKLNPLGSALVYSTFFSPGNDIAVDAAGSAYVTGSAGPDFPTTPDAFQRCCGGAIITKFDPTGSALLYSTYLGGNFSDFGLGIAVDAAGNAYIAGGTSSTNFPTTAGAFQSISGGSFDAFVVKFTGDNIAPNTTAASSPAANAAGWNNSPVAVTLSATDNGGGSGVKSITYSVNTGAAVTVNGATAAFTLFADGVYTVSFNATDNAGNPEASRTLMVRIDQTPPSGTLSLSPSPLWPPNHKLVTITPSLAVSDAGGGPVTVSGPIVSSNEPVTGGDDVTSPDWVVSGNTLQLRAERAEGSSGRVYTVSYTLTDQAGNSAQASSTVTVMKNRRRFPGRLRRENH